MTRAGAHGWLPRVLRALSLPLLWLALLWLALAPWALAAPAALPAAQGHVTDLTGTLDAAQRAALEQKLAAFEARKGSQLVVLVVGSTAPESIEAYALRVAEQWRPGRQRIDDGAILLIAKDDHALRIEVGYGLEGVLTDATCRRIIDELIAPRLRRQDFAGAIDAGVEQMMSVIDGEALPPPGTRPSENSSAWEVFGPLGLFGVLALATVARVLFGRARGAALVGVLVGGVVWWLVGAWLMALAAGAGAALLALIGGLGRGIGVGGPFGGGRSGGDGGFRGGGGGFGGGGASGKW